MQAKANKGKEVQQVKRRFFTGWKIGILALLLGYTLFGFLIAPYIAKKELIAHIKKDLGRNAGVEKVLINPFTFKLTIRNLYMQEKDGSLFADFDELYVDYDITI